MNIFRHSSPPNDFYKIIYARLTLSSTHTSHFLWTWDGIHQTQRRHREIAIVSRADFSQAQIMQLHHINTSQEFSNLQVSMCNCYFLHQQFSIQILLLYPTGKLRTFFFSIGKLEASASNSSVHWHMVRKRERHNLFHEQGLYTTASS